MMAADFQLRRSCLLFTSHLLSMRNALLLVLLLWVFGAHSEVPPKATKPSKEAAAKRIGTEQQALSVKGISSKSKQEVALEAKEREEKIAIDRGIRDYTGYSALFTLFLVVVAVVQVGLFRWQLMLMNKATEEAGTAAKAALAQANALTNSERAYVKMSHTSPAGLSIDRRNNLFWVTIQVKNWGRTPARITDVVVTGNLVADVDSLPELPDYPTSNDRRIRKAFLVTGEEFFFNEHFHMPDAKVLDQVQSAEQQLVVFGYVDYIDQFGQRHRAGYARVYDPLPAAAANNLSFVERDGYNYDRPRRWREGNDWDPTKPEEF